MNYETVSYFLQTYFSIHSWQDGLEILFFASIIYGISVWLKQDKTQKLLPAFYSYIGAFYAAHFFNMPTIQNSLLFAAPIVGTLTIIYHQRQLQKNFILARKQPLEPAKIAAPNWIETCIRSCLIISHHKKEVTCIIENFDSLETILQKPFYLDIHMQKDILNLLLLSDNFLPRKPIWLTRNGKIVSINCDWGENITQDSLFTERSDKPKWQTYGAMITEKTDALLFHINAKTAKGGICYRGETITKLTSEQVLQFIKQAMHKQNKNNVSYEKGDRYENEKRPII